MPWMAAQHTGTSLISFNNTKQNERSPPETKATNWWEDVGKKSVLSKVLLHDLRDLERMLDDSEAIKHMVSDTMVIVIMFFILTAG